MQPRRYYTDAYTTQFVARAVERLDQAGRPAVVLDETYFYPTSGGQPYDRGRIGNATVEDVAIRESDGAVLHRLDRPIDLGEVTATIDWPRRWDHMQQHTGQHVLSQAFIQTANAATIGFHLGDEYVSIDLDRADLGDDAVERSFELANSVVERNLPVRAWFPDPAEVATLGLRKTPDVDGPLRVVDIGDFDRTACGGTHLSATGELGLIHHLKTERLKRGTRILFLTGRRARADYARRHHLLGAVAQQLTCSFEEVPAAVTRLQQTAAEAERLLQAQREAALDAEARQLAEAAKAGGAPALVRRVWPASRAVEEVRGLVLRMTSEPGMVVLMAIPGDKATLIFGQSEAGGHDLNRALKAALATLGGGRGGGARIVQGGGVPATADLLERALDAAAGAL